MSSPPPPITPTDSNKKKGLTVVLTLSVLIGGGIAAYFMLVTAPEAQPEAEVRAPKIVQTIELTAQDIATTVRADGTVIPARTVTIKPEVAGRVARAHPSLVPGGYIPQGAEVLGIDRATYELSLNEQEAALQEATFELEVERGRQVVAEREWEQLKNDLPDADINQALVLRQPHLRRAEALIRKADNAIAQARLDLERTSIPCPFNAIVIDESIEVGQVIESRTSVATLVGADEFWVQVSMPLEELRHVLLPRDPEPGANATIMLDAGDGTISRRQGQVIRLLGDLDQVGRMVRLLVSVQNPLNLDGENASSLPLLLGSYVSVEIEADVQHDVLVIDRKALRNGDRIWIVDQDKKLQMRDVHVIWRRTNDVLIASDAVKPGELLIVSGLRTATPGMLVNPQPALTEPTAP
ncbi:MAG: efflux RND transporter periplasmic adaptor subunit [Verrucomicrobiales bacterium]